MFLRLMVDHAVWQYLQGTVVLSQLPVTLRCMIVQQATAADPKGLLGTYPLGDKACPPHA